MRRAENGARAELEADGGQHRGLLTATITPRSITSIEASSCDEYCNALTAAGMNPKHEYKGNCYDNAAMESFWSTQKNETDLDAAEPISHRATELIFNNPTRCHSSLGHFSLVAFEKQNQ